MPTLHQKKEAHYLQEGAYLFLSQKIDMNKVAIMQPTYLPWYGYFELINNVDTFVFLDSVQFVKRSWQQRNLIKTPTGSIWLTVPVLSKGKRNQLIKDTILNKEKNFLAKHIKSLHSNYSNSIYFDSESKYIFKTMQLEYTYISELNIELIKTISKMLNIRTKFLKSSDLDCYGNKADLLANICARLNATEYISTPGSAIYLEKSNSFEEIGLQVSYFEYSKHIYNQLWGDFIPNLSIIDMLFNCGEETRELLNKKKLV